MRAAVVFGALLLPVAAAAQSMVATRPGLMCTEPGALATLTMPDGSNRGASDHARPGDDAVKQQGGCIDIPSGARVAVHQRRINTSIVSFDAGDGRGDRTWIVPNIDFSLAQQTGEQGMGVHDPVQHETVVEPPPVGTPRPEAAARPVADPVAAFFTQLQSNCPDHGWDHADMQAYGPPLEEAAKSLSTEQHDALNRDVRRQCQPGDTLECGNTIAIRHIVQAGRLDTLTQAFCTAAPRTADSVRY